jgi:hypothetical protein
VRTFHCPCGATVFFDNSRCLTCGRELGFLPDALLLTAIESTPDGGFATPNGVYAKCVNYASEGVCNWMVPASPGSGPGVMCQACALNRVIPDLALPANRERWAEVEKAKRRLIYGLDRLRLPLQSKAQNPGTGLAFDIKADVGSARVLTGHDDGLITMNLAEADAPTRERVRVAMKEGYRTLLGHFRHEIGHYYWDRLVRDGAALSTFRSLFGDERIDYADALKRHYASDAPVDAVSDAFISRYAASHPWEDFAETFAHYLHLDDTLETAQALGFAPASPGAAGDRGAGFATTLGQWVELTLALNALNRSMGLRDAYPFALSPVVREKLQFVHELVVGAARPRG